MTVLLHNAYCIVDNAYQTIRNDSISFLVETQQTTLCRLSVKNNRDCCISTMHLISR